MLFPTTRTVLPLGTWSTLQVNKVKLTLDISAIKQA
jgi:hypothetical protein